ncbi:uncharacterized protein LOC113334170 isoform X1 [Papaver somniferum]|uniref:uncharacterized protein LOC113334170 isoform X1 n=1 Tax=Papaver somniferum TaxID=3469 RepID=UPI000E6F4F80|nr:uncharacterized protein LOC113334170 isoform X1 [Papaver somniferum]
MMQKMVYGEHQRYLIWLTKDHGSFRKLKIPIIRGSGRLNGLTTQAGSVHDNILICNDRSMQNKLYRNSLTRTRRLKKKPLRKQREQDESEKNRKLNEQEKKAKGRGDMEHARDKYRTDER